MRCPLLSKSSCLGVATSLLLALPILAQAESASSFWHDFQAAQAQGVVSHQFEIDNDSLLLRDRDGLYTSGGRYTQQYAMRTPDRLDQYGWRIGQAIYTPSDIKLAPAAISRSDHPYAGWLYGGVFRAAHFADGRNYRYGLDLGCVGPCAGGEWVQSRLHHLIDQPQPQGWSQQIKNELGTVLYADYAPRRWQITRWIDVTPSVHGRFGNVYTDAGASLLLRSGRLNLLPDQPSLHGFMRFDARAVGYNAMLQGGYFSSGNPRTVVPKRLVGEAEIGVAWNNAPFALSASIVRRSTEISALSNAAGAENFARLLFSYTPR